MRRREFIRALAGALVAAADPFTSRARAAARAGSPPNVVFCFSDEHRWHSMAFTEMPDARTPNMAKLASQGVEFTHCISNYPVCSPYRAMLMTSRWPCQQSVIDNDIALSHDEHTLGKAFKAGGYDTAYIGKWHLGGTRAEPLGFDHSLVWTDTNSHHDKSLYHPAEGDPQRPKGYNATLMTDQAIEYIDGRKDSGKPFFLMLSWNPPHARFTDAPESMKAHYDRESLPFRPNVPDRVKTSSEGTPAIAKQNDWTNYQGYHAHITAIDSELGRLMDKLDEMGISDNTILVYTSDHGTMFGSHGVGSKRQPYDESIRVPFLIRWPGVIPANRRDDSLFGAVDIMPTLCSLAGVTVPTTCMGLDFAPAMKGGRGPCPESQFIMHISKRNASGGEKHPAPLFRGVRTRDFTYAIKPDGSGFLFDNNKDPFQLNNLFERAEFEETRRKLEALTRDWLKKASDPFVIAERAGWNARATGLPPGA